MDQDLIKRANMTATKNYRTLKFRIDKNLSQSDLIKLWTLSLEHTKLYNHLLDQTKNESIGCDFKKLNQSYKDFRLENQLTIPSKSAQNTCASLINNIKSFFALRKTDKNAKFPRRYKSSRNFQTFTYDWNNGCGGFFFTKTELVIRQPNEIRIVLPQFVLDDYDFDDVKIVTFYEGEIPNSIFCSITVSKFASDRSLDLDPSRFLSIDPGLSSIVSGITCDGKAFKIKNKDFRGEDKANDRIKSKRDRKKKHSRRYARLNVLFKRKSAKTKNKRKDFHHKLTKSIVDFCISENIGQIIHGDINTKSLTKTKFANKGLNRSSQNRGTLSRIKSFLAYKAFNSGISHELQNEAYTSKTNCYTGEIIQNMNLSVRKIPLTENLTIDRDINGAINIAIKFFSRHSGSWSPQIAWLSSIKDTQIRICV